MVVLMTLLRPFVYLWAGLQVMDSLSFGTRVARLVFATVRHQRGDEEMCSVCDDVMGDLLAGNEGLEAILPLCKGACFGFNNCIQMCTKVQEVSSTSLEFPCVAAGFCPKMLKEEETKTAEELLTTCADKNGLFQCKPKQYCHRVRRGLKWKCELRPGIKGWTGMKQLASQHTAALVSGLVSQKHCGEPDAGQYCIARPQGFSIFSDTLGNIISLGLGGYKSIVAIESPGGSDDRQWLTFWLMLSIMLYLENNFARVILSSVPLYFEIKLAMLLWLMWWEGADLCYRRLKRFLQNRNWIISSDGKGTLAQGELDRLGNLLGEDLLKKATQIQSINNTLPSSDEWDYDSNSKDSIESQANTRLYNLSCFLLSTEGARMLAGSGLAKASVHATLERAAACASFHPRYLNLTLVGAIPGPSGEVPSMDPNGLADPYVVCRLIPPLGKEAYPSAGVVSSIQYKTLSPQWNQTIEIPVRGGEHDEAGYYQSQAQVNDTKLHLFVHDADVGLWSVMYRFFKIVAPLSVAFLFVLPRLHRETMLWWDNARNRTFTTVWACIAIICYVVSFVMAVIYRRDDEPIGECTIPMSILMDQSEQTLLLKLQPPIQQSIGNQSTTEARTNSVGGQGIIKVKLSLSET